MTVILGDNLFEDDLAPQVREFQATNAIARVLLSKVSDPGRFGVAEIKNRYIVGIEEKPKLPKSDLAVTGVYLYTPDVFSHIRSLRPSARGELEITVVNNAYIRAERMSWGQLSGWWSDAGTHPSLARACELVREKPPQGLGVRDVDGEAA